MQADRQTHTHTQSLFLADREDSDQELDPYLSLKHTEMALIKLRVNLGLSESSLGARVILFVLLCSGSNIDGKTECKKYSLQHIITSETQCLCNVKREQINEKKNLNLTLS